MPHLHVQRGLNPSQMCCHRMATIGWRPGKPFDVGQTTVAAIYTIAIDARR
jgi:hypothetical protein